MNQNRLPWWLGIVTGIIFVFVGWELVTNTALATIDLVVLLGLYWIVAGIIDIIIIAFDHEIKHVGIRLASSIIGIIAGIVIINHAILATVITVEFLAYLIAFAFMFSGFAHIFIGSQNRSTGAVKWSWGSLIIGVIYLLFGLFVIAGPTLFVAAGFIWAMGVFAMIGGIVSIASAFAFRKS